MKAQAPMAHGGEPILLYAGPPPGSESWDHSPREYYSDIFATEVVTNVVTPALTPFLPETDIATGTAVIVAPGGGFHALSINSEGNDAARWLNARGVAAFVLRYRLVPSGHDAVAELVAKLPQQSTDDMAMVRPLAVVSTPPRSCQPAVSAAHTVLPVNGSSARICALPGSRSVSA